MRQQYQEGHLWCRRRKSGSARWNIFGVKMTNLEIGFVAHL